MVVLPDLRRSFLLLRIEAVDPFSLASTTSQLSSTPYPRCGAVDARPCASLEQVGSLLLVCELVALKCIAGWGHRSVFFRVRVYNRVWVDNRDIYHNLPPIECSLTARALKLLLLDVAELVTLHMLRPHDSLLAGRTDQLGTDIWRCHAEYIPAPLICR